MTIELKPEQEQLLNEALRQGRFQTMEEALAQALNSILVSAVPTATPTATPMERAAAFRAWAADHPHTTPVLTDEAISRESIYSGRG